MKRLTFVILLVFQCSVIQAQTILGKWKTIDDETGKARSIVEIYEDNGKVFGKILEIVNPKKKNALCTKCDGENKNKPIVGLQIIQKMEKSKNGYEGGTILNPDNGKVYKCRLQLEEDSNTLRVRGYLAFFYKTQYWKRIKK